MSHSLQIILLIIIGNYIVILMVQLVLRVIENIYIAKKANKLYPYLKGKNNAKLSKEDSKAFL